MADEKRKPGRPTAQNPLTVQVKVRMNKGDAERLDSYCKRHSTTRASAMRSAMLAEIDRDEQTE